jgi:pimeloyl-ACP methyl ester carboxylesterase
MTKTKIHLTFAIGLGLAACAQQEPYRSLGFDDDASCRAIYAQPEVDDEIPQRGHRCWQRAIEEHAGFDLLFAEFDDQGWIQGTADKVHDGPDHLDRLMDKLGRLASKETAPNGISLVVFVHGWHHNADANDRNVRDFRDFLRDMAVLEGETEHRRVIGLYVGWRGESVDLPGVKVLTFWDRKATAEKVAQGSVRELFARLDAWRDSRRAKIPKPRLLVIGHSFGGLITYESLSSEFIRYVADHVDRETNERQADVPEVRRERFLDRIGDLVVIVNPAFEGTRYEPLHAAARRMSAVREGQLPMLITATSVADQATRVSFPLARRLNSIFETDPGAEHEANIRTVGHNARYTTHQLSLCLEGDSSCRRTPCGALAALAEQTTRSARNERVRSEVEQVSLPKLVPFGAQATLCDGLMLEQTGQWRPQGNPFWVLQTTGDIMMDHNDIFNPAFVSFIRQTYIAIRKATKGGVPR